MDEYDFEELVADLWDRAGWSTEVTSGSGDRGIDVIATRTEMTTEKQIIQAKRYSEGNTVGSQDVRNYATLHQQEPDVDSVVIVTTSRFTEQATQLANDLKVKLVDGDSLCRRISQLAQHTPDGKPSADSSSIRSTPTGDDSILSPDHSQQASTKTQRQNKNTPQNNDFTHEESLWLQSQLEKWESAAHAIMHNGENKIIEPIGEYSIFISEAISTNSLDESELQSHKKV
jgi:hypothetical protein